MKTLLNVKPVLGKVNDLVEKVSVNLSWIMLLAITLLNIVQVFYRYVLNNALSWSEEASSVDDGLDNLHYPAPGLPERTQHQHDVLP